MGAVHHIAAKSKAREGVFHHIMHRVQPGVGTFKGSTFLGVYRTNLQCQCPNHTCTLDADISKRMGMELVDEMVNPTSCGDISVRLCVRGHSFEMVKIFHRHHSTRIQTSQHVIVISRIHRGKHHLKPTCHHPSKIEQQTTVSLTFGGLQPHRVHNAVARKLLWRNPHSLQPHHRGWPPSGLNPRIVAFSAKLQRLPTARIAVGAGRCLPSAISNKERVNAITCITVNYRLCHSRHFVYPSPTLPQPEDDFILSIPKTWTNIVCNRQRVLVELRHSRLHHPIAHRFTI